MFHVNYKHFIFYKINFLCKMKSKYAFWFLKLNIDECIFKHYVLFDFNWFKCSYYYLAEDEHVMTFLVGYPIDGLLCFVWAINLLEVLFHYFGMYRYLFLRVFKGSVNVTISGGIKLKKKCNVKFHNKWFCS